MTPASGSTSPDAITVLYADNSYTFGGAINALAHLLSAVRGVRPVVMSAQPLEVLHDLFPNMHSHHWRVRLNWVHDRFDRRVTSWPGFQAGPLLSGWKKLRALGWLALIDVPEAMRVLRLARANGVQLVHLNNGVDGMLSALIAAKLLRLPVIAHARGPVATEGVARAYAGMADHWIAVSGEMARNLRAAGVDESRTTVVHDAIDLTQFTQSPAPSGLRDELGIPEDARLFGVFARIVDWKGIREFVHAARIVIQRVPAAHAIVVGDASDGSEEYYRGVIHLAAELGIADRVHFTGFREDVADLMRMCDVVVHSSIVPEPFGMTVIEAMATGTPVVAANAGGPTEIIPSSEYGLLVDPTVPEELADAVVQFLEDPALAAYVGANGARRIREHFSAERYARDVEAVYAQVLPDPASASARLNHADVRPMHSR